MLATKRASVLRRVDLNFNVDGRAITKSDPVQISEIEKDLATARANLKAAEENAARYSGGLVQSMALVQVETARVTEAQLVLAYFSAKYGMGFPRVNLPGNQPSPKAGQRTSEDRDAL